MIVSDSGEIKLKPSELVESFEKDWNSEHESNLLNPNCIFIDQTFDSYNYLQAENGFSTFKVESININNGGDDIYVKTSAEEITNSFKLVIKREQIMSIQYLGNFN